MLFAKVMEPGTGRAESQTPDPLNSGSFHYITSEAALHNSRDVEN